MASAQPATRQAAVGRRLRIVPRPRLEFRVLGPLELSADGRPLPLAGELPRALLSLLLIHLNKVVSRDILLDQLWDGRPPRTANDSLNNIACRLRKQIGPGPLQTRPSGYLLRVDSDQLDLCRFEQLLARQAAQSDGERIATLEHALSLWRGLPFEDVLYASFAQPEIRRVEELQLDAYEQLCRLKLEHNDTSVLPLLHMLVTRHPLRERLRCQLMRALAATGRQADALATYHDYRHALAELDLAPGTDIETVRRQLTVAARPAPPLSRRSRTRTAPSSAAPTPRPP